MSQERPDIIAPQRCAQLIPRPAPDANKYSRGALAVVGGSRDYPGAPVLAAKAAARCGAGYVRLVMPADAAASARSHVLSVPVTACAQDVQGGFAEAAAHEAASSLAKSRALVAGPGLGTSAQAGAFLGGLFADLPNALRLQTVVLDADALNLVAAHPALADALGAYQVIMTPHEGEAARLLGRPVRERLEDARELAARFRATVVLKGPRTLVADGHGRAAVNESAGPELAKAGTGDVLAGMVGAFAAQGLAAFEAAELAVFLHGRTAHELTSQMSVNAVMPEDIIEHIGTTTRRLEREFA